MGNKSLILNNDDIQKKIARISYQIIENYYDEKEVVLVGLSKRGFLFAEFIFKKLKEINSKINFKLLELNINKNNPNQSNISIKPIIDLKNKKVILIDDVLNSGRTLMHAAAYLLNQNISKMNTIVLVDRRHRLFPIKADWVGLTLSTTLQEHIRVNFEKDNILIYLE
ncbi:MAG: phosphoribosyltransferase [Crocinitomicaceae bacterium]|nr:phosphoribosyltransferase [Crocinitomicaceae bacterium]|tara:strand:+ start:11221 stop:11724 length:504 start_codon:yes stop_codon:yes gene_type:complete